MSSLGHILAQPIDTCSFLAKNALFGHFQPAYEPNKLEQGGRMPFFPLVSGLCHFCQGMYKFLDNKVTVPFRDLLIFLM